jgi:hypothetical protein
MDNIKIQKLPEGGFLGAIFLCVSILFSMNAAARGKRPVVFVDEIVAGAGVSEKESSYLSSQIRSTTSKEAKNCNVLGARRTRSIKAKNRSEINSCSQSCEVAMGRLAEADFIITGLVQKTESGASLELKLFSVKSETLVSSKTRERYNMTEISEALPSMVSDLIAPLKSIVVQATDNEGPTEGPMKDPESVISASESPEDVELREEEPAPKQWEERKKKEKPSVFDEQSFGFISAAIYAGYPFIIERARQIGEAYTPLFHIGVEVAYQLFPFFQAALVGEFEQFKGHAFHSSEFARPEGDATFDTSIWADISNSWMLGFRPTFRFDIQLSNVELRIGVGIGFQHFVTSGVWYRMAKDYIPTPDTDLIDEETITVRQDVTYSFEQSTNSFYSAFDFALYYRFADRRYGVGVFACFIVPVMNIDDPNPSVRIEEDTGTYVDEDYEDLLDEDDYPESLFENEPDEGDYRNTVIRHLKSMYMITAGLTLDVRF